jgi:ubiquinone/menaquinone biosynthesis C-methylase UbiE
MKVINVVEGIMFLSERTTQAEYFDEPRSPSEQASFYASLRQVNRLCVYAQPFKSTIPELLGPAACKELTLLDLGAGDGDLGRVLTGWASLRGWHWQFTSLDLSPEALQMGAGCRVAASVLDLPFAENSFDVVVASQMTHHLAPEQVVRHLRESWRVARRAVMVSDLHRNAFLYFSLKTLLMFGTHAPEFVSDALLSVRRGWRLGELRNLAKAAGLESSNVRLYFGTRILLYGRKN